MGCLTTSAQSIDRRRGRLRASEEARPNVRTGFATRIPGRVARTEKEQERRSNTIRATSPEGNGSRTLKAYWTFATPPFDTYTVKIPESIPGEPETLVAASATPAI
jgi:hypothetical protein